MTGAGRRGAVVAALVAATLTGLGLAHPWGNRAGPAPPRTCPPGTRPCPPPISSATTTTSPTLSGGHAPLYGVTVDDPSKMADVVAAAQAFGHRSTTRLVFNYGEQASRYAEAAQQLHPYSGILGLLLDSSDMWTAVQDPAAERRRVDRYLLDASLTANVDIWEVGNEVNGAWTCNQSQRIGCSPAQYRVNARVVTDTYEQVAAKGYRTALTLYENSWGPDNCGDGSGELTPQQYSQRFLSSSVRAGINYLLLSWYPSQCSTLATPEVPRATIAAEVQALHTLYPHAGIGFGELGYPDAIEATQRSAAESLIRYYYGLQISESYYVGGYFWWHYAEDALPYRNSLGQENSIWSAINTAFGTKRYASGLASRALSPPR